jgi:hypothetical protein
LVLLRRNTPIYLFQVEDDAGDVDLAKLILLMNDVVERPEVAGWVMMTNITESTDIITYSRFQIKVMSV